MVSSAILAAGAGVVGTLLGSGITAYANYRTNAQKLKEERKRIQAEIHSERQLEALMNLNTRLGEMKDTLTEIQSVNRERHREVDGEELREEYAEAIGKSNDFLLDISESRVFLNRTTERQVMAIVDIHHAMRYRLLRDLAPKEHESKEEFEQFYDVEVADENEAWQRSSEKMDDLLTEGFSKITSVQSAIRSRVREPIEHIEEGTRKPL